MHHRRAVRSDGTSWAAKSRTLLTVISLGSLLCIVVGATALAIGETRPLTRTTTAALPWTSTTTFGWFGSAAANDIYPDGRVQSPQPVFLRLLSDVTVTADVRTSGAVRSGSGPLTLRATLSDDTGWTRTWALDRAVAAGAAGGGSVHLSAPLQLGVLQQETAWNQAATGVSSPVTLTLTVDSGRPEQPPAHVAFSLGQLLFKPLGPLTTTTGGSVSTHVRTAGAVRLAGKAIAVETLRKAGALLLGVGVIGAVAATLAGRRRRRRPATPAHVRVQVPGQRAALDDVQEESLSL